MRKTNRSNRALVTRILAGALLAAAPAMAGTTLSPAQEKVIAEKTAKMSPAEKEEIGTWPDGKKLTEFFCTPLGLGEVKKVEKSADRLILGPDDAGIARFVVDGNRKVSGRGMVRLIGEWRDLSFECTLDPEEGTAKDFTFELDKK